MLIVLGLTVLLRSPPEANQLIELLMITRRLFCSFWHQKEKYFLSLGGFVRDQIKLLQELHGGFVKGELQVKQTQTLAVYHCYFFVFKHQVWKLDQCEESPESMQGLPDYNAGLGPNVFLPPAWAGLFVSARYTRVYKTGEKSSFPFHCVQSCFTLTQECRSFTVLFSG